MDLPFLTLLGLFIIAIISGVIDAIAGGGGLLTIPALLSVGIPPTMALGTNKLQSCGGSFSASLYFVQKNIVNPKAISLLILLTFIGASLGTILVQHIDVNLLTAYLPILIFIIGIYFLFTPNIGEQDKKQRMSLPLFAFTFAFAIGFYDGMFGPATGSFFTLAFVLLLGFNLTKSVAHAKVLNFTSNFTALVFFIIGGAVLWKVGFIMMIGQFIGGTLGARIVLHSGKKWIRPLLVIMSFSMVIKIMYQQEWLSF